MTNFDMLHSSPVKPSAPAAHPAHAASSVVTDPTLRLMAAAAAAAGGRPGRLATAAPSDLAPRPSVAAAAAANELYASLLYSHQHQLDRAAMMMHQHAHHAPFSPVPTASSQRGQQPSQAPSAGAACQPPQAHTGGFALPQYQSSHPHPHHLQAAGPAAAAAFESYSQSLATLSQLSQRLQLHAGPHSRLPGPPTALGVDPYLAAAAAAAHGGRAGSPAAKRPGNLAINSPPRTPVVDDSQTPLISTRPPSHQSARHGNPYDFCEQDLSPDDKFRIRYKHDDVKEPSRHRHHHHHHHESHHHQQQRKPDVGVVGVTCRDENHNAFNMLQLHRRDKRHEPTTAHAHTVLPLAPAHDRQHDERRHSASGDAANKGVATLTGNGNDVIGESPSGPEVSVSGVEYKSGGLRRHQRTSTRRPDFTHGSRIQLSDGRVKRIEDMRTEDFVVNASSSSLSPAGGRGVTSSQLVLVSSRVVHIRLNHDLCTAVLGFIVDNNIHSPVFVDFCSFLFCLFPILLTYVATGIPKE